MSITLSFYNPIFFFILSNFFFFSPFPFTYVIEITKNFHRTNNIGTDYINMNVLSQMLLLFSFPFTKFYWFSKSNLLSWIKVDYKSEEENDNFWYSRSITDGSEFIYQLYNTPPFSKSLGLLLDFQYFLTFPAVSTPYYFISQKFFTPPLPVLFLKLGSKDYVLTNFTEDTLFLLIYCLQVQQKYYWGSKGIRPIKRSYCIYTG